MSLADMSSLAPTARVILGFLSFEPRRGYDIKQVADLSTRFFWGASYGQIYPELRRLEPAGLVESLPSHGAGCRDASTGSQRPGSVPSSRGCPRRTISTRCVTRGC